MLLKSIPLRFSGNISPVTENFSIKNFTSLLYVQIYTKFYSITFNFDKVMLYIAIYVAPLKLRPYGSIQICIIIIIIIIIIWSTINQWIFTIHKKNVKYCGISATV